MGWLKFLVLVFGFCLFGVRLRFACLLVLHHFFSRLANDSWGSGRMTKSALSLPGFPSTAALPPGIMEADKRGLEDYLMIGEGPRPLIAAER